MKVEKNSNLANGKPKNQSDYIPEYPKCSGMDDVNCL